MLAPASDGKDRVGGCVRVRDRAGLHPEWLPPLSGEKHKRAKETPFSQTASERKNEAEGWEGPFPFPPSGPCGASMSLLCPPWPPWPLQLPFFSLFCLDAPLTCICPRSQPGLSPP